MDIVKFQNSPGFFPPACLWWPGRFLLLLLLSTGIVQANSSTPIEVLWQKAQRQNPMSDSTRIYLGEVIDLAQKIQDMEYEAKGHYHLGRHYFLLMQTRNAHEHFLRARELFLKMKNWEKVGFANLQLGLAYSQENELDSAISFFQRAITIYTDHDLSRHLWTPYMGISNVYGKAENISAAFRYGRKAIASLKPEVDRVSKVIAYNHMLRLAREQDSLHIYAIYADELLKLYSPIENYDQVLQHIDHFVNIKDPADRIDALKSSIHRQDQWPPTLELVSSYYQLGQSYREINHFHEALKALHAAYDIEKDSLKIVHFTPVLLRALSTQYEQLGQYPKALEYYKKYESVKDSLVKENTKARTEELQLQFESRAKDQQITGQQQLVERLTTQRNLIIGLSVILLLVGGYVFYIQRRHLKDQVIIARQKEALHQNEIHQLKKQHEVASLQTLITTQEEERKRIAQDLHDSLGALLATLRNKTHPGNNIDLSSTQDQLRLIDTVNAEVRRIAYNMMPPALIHMGLSAAIEDLVDALQQDKQLKISFQNIDYDQALDRDKEITLYRIVQELCTNVVRHAEARHLLIQLSRFNGTASLVVEDDGKGFDVALQPHGMGMDSVRTRVEYLQGLMEIWTKPGEGTSITINVPAE
jgi:signal transduction histidine kinase